MNQLLLMELLEDALRWKNNVTIDIRELDEAEEQLI